jgi:hypothetical protein
MLGSFLAAVIAVLPAPAPATLEVATVAGGARTVIAQGENGYGSVAWAGEGIHATEYGGGERILVRTHRPDGGGSKAALRLETDDAVTVSPDGRFVAVAGARQIVIRRVADGGVAARARAPVRGAFTPDESCWSRDGARFAADFYGKYAHRQLIVPTTGEATRTLTDTLRTRGIGCFTADGSGVLVVNDETGALGRRDLRTKRFTATPGVDVFLASDASLSPDGRHMAVNIGDRAVVVDPATGRGMVEPRDNGREYVSHDDATWSPDGRWLAYRRIRVPDPDAGDPDRATYALIARRIDPPGPEHVLATRNHGDIGAFAWSPDATKIVFTADVRAEAHVSTPSRSVVPIE